MLPNVTYEKLIVNCTYYYFKTIGLATFGFQYKPMNNNKKQRATFTRSNIGIMYNILLTFLGVTLFYIYFLLNYTIGNISFVEATDLVDVSLGVISATTILIFICTRQDKSIEIATKMKNLLKLSTNDKVYGEKFDKFWMIRQVGLTNSTMWLLIFVTASLLPGDWISYFISTTFCDFIIIGTMMQYSIVLKIMQDIMKRMNANFISMSKRTFNYTNIYLTRTSIEPGIEDDIHQFLHLREIFFLLCEVSTNISDYYSLPILLTTFYTFIILLFYCYTLASSMISKNQSMNIYVLVNCLAEMLNYTVTLVMLAKSASVVIRESKKTGKIINMWIKNTKNQQIVTKLNQFSVALLHQHIEFSVAGLFVLNESLIVSILGSITTYVVILLQFQDKTQQ